MGTFEKLRISLSAGLVAIMLIATMAFGSNETTYAADPDASFQASDETPESGEMTSGTTVGADAEEFKPTVQGNCDVLKNPEGCTFDLNVGENEVVFIKAFGLVADGVRLENCVLVVAYAGSYEDLWAIDGGYSLYNTERYDIVELAEFESNIQETYACAEKSLDDMPVLGELKELVDNDNDDNGDSTIGEDEDQTKVIDLGAV